MKQEGCDGWAQTSLDECKLKCDANEVPVGCLGSMTKNETCKYVIWYNNSDHLSGWCHLADESCEIETANAKNVQVWTASGQ